MLVSNVASECHVSYRGMAHMQVMCLSMSKLCVYSCAYCVLTGQSYEVKVKKLGDLSEYHGKCMRVCLASFLFGFVCLFVFLYLLLLLLFCVPI